MMNLLFVTGCGEDTASKNSSKVLRVGTDASYAPFGFQDENSKDYVGYDIDIIKAIAKDQNLEIDIRNLNFDGLIPALQTGDLDIAISDLTVTPDRAKSVDFSEPYYIAGLGIVVAKDDDTIHSAADLPGKKVAVTIGSTGAEAAHKIDGIEIREFSTLADAFLELRNGGVDAVVNDIPTNEYFVKNKGSDFAKTVDAAINKEDLAIAVKKGNTDLLNKINKGLADIKSNGQYAEIYKKWFGKEPVNN